MKRFGSSLFAAAIATAVVAGPAVSHADIITYLITSDHCSGGCLTGQTNGGTITLTDISGGVQVGISLANGNEFVNGGQDSTIGFNLLNTPTITAGSFSNSAFTLLSGTAGSVHDDGVGTFEYGILQNTATGGGAAVPGPLTFDIFGTGVTAASFTTNSNGQFFAIDALSGTTGNTGFLDASVRAVPAPVVGMGLPGLVAGCLSLFALARRRQHRAA